jgi:capsular exopolysaccharide synthesis family protein
MPVVPSDSLSSAQSGEDNADFDPRELLRVVLKRWRLMAAVVSSAMLISVACLFLSTPVWQATATVKLPDSNKGSDPLKELVALSSSSDPIETYMEIARSFNVAIRAAQAVDLKASAQFASAKSLSSAAESLVKRGLVTVSNIKQSDVLEFDVRVQDPVLAVNLANAWSQAFIDANLDFERIGASSRRAFIDTQLAGIRVELTSGEKALERLSERQETLHPGGAGAATRDNPIVALQTKVQDLLIQRSDLASRYSQDYPEVKEVNAEYKEAVAELNREMERLPADDMDYTRLAREVTANETIYNLLLEKDQEARIEENVNDIGIVVVDPARPSDQPVSPKKIRILAMGLLLGALLSVAAAWSLEHWSDEVGGESDMAKLSGLPMLAMISDWRAELRGSDEPPPVSPEPALARAELRHDPASLITRPQLKHTYYNESFRILRTNLAFSGVDRQMKAFCVVSPNAREGKTLTNANLALALAATGKKVLLVDADLRKPSIHKLFDLKVRKDQGLPHVLSGRSTDLKGHLYPGPVPGLWLLPCGVVPPNPSELLGSGAFVAAVRAMKRRFDHVLFDVSPILPVTDGVVLATRMDGVAILVRFEQTRRVEFKRAFESLAAVNAPLVGTILNAVDMRKYSYAYGYGNRYYSYHEKST